MTFDEYLQQNEVVDKEEALLTQTRDEAKELLRSLGYNSHDVQAKTRSNASCYAILICNAFGGSPCVERYLKLNSRPR